jgi:hypothetical protein
VIDSTKIQIQKIEQWNYTSICFYLFYFL